MSARSSSPRSTRTIPGFGLRSVILPLRGKRHPELGRRRLVVTRAGETDAMTLKPECASPTEALKSELAATLRAVTKLAAMLNLLAPPRCRMTAR